ncbi:AsnC family transcriptional regulator [Alkalispirillum mobile]|uniref:AsnC family transcriptional regulator n=1 Tax=Alkalispirillum mobile TaxID=85925 RepID=A0A498C009_9GAMM|nr:MarR family EPS-associated transcriptional regulator [Alkalispirillum mobile]RLK48379.1 AsnC family transcriptional regulator [Alkalispirillum mobile]
MTRDEIQLIILHLLKQNPNLSQRDLAGELGISLGRAHYCLRALIEKGWVKAINFSRSPTKRRYLYQLTPSGLSEKAHRTRKFLAKKRADYEALREEIKTLEREIENGELLPKQDKP